MENEVGAGEADRLRDAHLEEGRHSVEKLVGRPLVVALQHKRALVSLHKNDPVLAVR
jgi:hypothetical protein